MRVVMCGVRGSTPAPGPQFVRYGGNTSCVALAHDGQLPTLLLDGGTGLRRVQALMDGEPFEGSIVLGHLHWDHTQGLPFFRSGDRPDARVTVHIPAQGDPLEVLSRAMSPPHFPIRPDELQGRWTFHGLEPAEHDIEGFAVRAVEVPHKGGRTFGYRITDGTGTVTYVSDHCPTAVGPGPDGLGEYHAAALELSKGSDLLIHDAQYTETELLTRAHYGHSASMYPVHLARIAGAGSVALYHHDSARTDDEVDDLVAACQAAAPDQVVMGAAEGTVIDLVGS